MAVQVGLCQTLSETSKTGFSRVAAQIMLNLIGDPGIDAIVFEPVREKNQQFGFPTRSYTNQAAQSQKMARSLKFWI